MSELLKSGIVGTIIDKAIEGGVDPKSREVRMEIIHNWDNTGLLGGLFGYEKERVAFKLEETARVLVKYPEAYDEKIVGQMGFPIIRRILSKMSIFDYRVAAIEDKSSEEWLTHGVDRNEMLMEILDPNMVLNKLDEGFDTTVELVKKLNGDKVMDFEAEACAMLADEITEMHVRQHHSYLLKRNADGIIKISKSN